MKKLKIFLVILSVVLVAEFAAVYIYFYMALEVPAGIGNLERNSCIYDVKGNILGELRGKVSREPVPIDRIPVHVREAFVAIEDQRFYEHSGVDLRSVMRALYGNLQQGQIVQGGSTITQQVIKIYYLSPERTYSRKIQEALMSLQYEREHEKSEILELYLNGIYLGEGTCGVQAAAKKYFNKNASELSIAEGAMLAGLSRAPGYYNPYANLRRGRERRNFVIAKMLEQGLIDRAAASEARQSPLELNKMEAGGEISGQSYYVDHVIEEATRLVGQEAVYGGGLKIITAYDPSAQSVANSVLAEKVFPDDKMQCALVLLDSRTGEIKSLVGGRTYEARRGFNRATQMKRQPGSSLKPVTVYGPALELGYLPDSILEDSPWNWEGYSPRNDDGRFLGSITLEKALQWSRNVPAVWLLDRIGIDQGFSFALRLGLKLDARDRQLPLALGGLTRGVSPLEMAGAYSCFANGGYYIPPHAITKIEDQTGRVLYRVPEPVQVMALSTARTMTEILKGTVNGGTATSAMVSGCEAAGKSGTTELPHSVQYEGVPGNKDAWFVGYAGEYTCAVWIGYDEKDMDRSHYLVIYGGDEPAEIFGRVMSGVLAIK